MEVGTDLRKFLPPDDAWYWHSREQKQRLIPEEGKIIKEVNVNNLKGTWPFPFMIRKVWQYVSVVVDEEVFRKVFDSEGKEEFNDIVYDMNFTTSKINPEIDKILNKKFFKIEKLKNRENTINFRIILNETVASQKHNFKGHLWLHMNGLRIKIVDSIYVGSNQAQFSQNESKINLFGSKEILRKFWWYKKEYMHNKKRIIREISISDEIESSEISEEERKPKRKFSEINASSKIETLNNIICRNIKNSVEYINTLKKDVKLIRSRIIEEEKRVVEMKNLLKKESNQVLEGLENLEEANEKKVNVPIHENDLNLSAEFNYFDLSQELAKL